MLRRGDFCLSGRRVGVSEKIPKKSDLLPVGLTVQDKEHEVRDEPRHSEDPSSVGIWKGLSISINHFKFKKYHRCNHIDSKLLSS